MNDDPMVAVCTSDHRILVDVLGTRCSMVTCRQAVVRHITLEKNILELSAVQPRPTAYNPWDDDGPRVAAVADGQTGKYSNVRIDGIRFHPGEPWFLIRGQDRFAYEAIQAYADCSELASIGAEAATYMSALDRHSLTERLRKTAREVRGFAVAVHLWQSENPDKVKLPD